MNFKPMLMGSETEYSVSVLSPGQRGRSHSPERIAQWLAEGATHESRCLPGTPGTAGVFLENGGRFYNDINGHPEYSTPECSSPEQLTLHDKAGELFVLRLADRVKTRHGVQVTVTKNNLTPVLPDSVSMGNHESYLCWHDLSKAAAAILPHLVSRLPYAGAGCLSAHPNGMGFELSQRARYLVRDVGPETTHDRAIFCTRIRKNSDASSQGWTRAHLISKDSQRSPLGTYLTFGTTALLFWILNQGGDVGQGLALKNPVQALRAISLDPWLRERVAMQDGRHLTCLEIQFHYLEECERCRGILPPWSERLLCRWRAVLETLARDPMELATQLDPYTKLLMVQHELRQAGMDGAQLREALKMLGELRRMMSHQPFIRDVLSGDIASLPGEHRQAGEEALRTLEAAGPAALDHVRFSLRLQVLDLKYHELGGIYDQLALAGKLESVVTEPGDVERAVTEPPPGRAAVRGSLIKDHHGQPGWCADWQFVLDQSSQRVFDLRDPFATEAKLMPCEQIEETKDSALSWNLLRRLIRSSIP